jgi:hypothetical protein
MHAQPRPEHHWLTKLVGEWTYETEASMGLGLPPEKFRGTVGARSLGGLWVLIEGSGDMPGGGTATTLMTLGYDPAKKCFVGSFIGSMMSNLWLYENGQLDSAGTKLTLEAEGPDFSTEGKTSKYRDVIEVQSDDHHILTSHVLGPDGQWQGFMTAHYRRKQ